MHRYMIHISKLTQILKMLLKSNRRMHCLCFERQQRWTHFLSVVWLWLLAPASPKALGYFLGDTKAVLNGCGDHWTLQDRTAMPLLFQMTVCVDIRVVVPGAWVAFSYSSIYAPRPELGLEGDDEALYGWLLRVRHRFPVRLSPKHWHRVCLRRDMLHNSFSLEVDGRAVSERTVIARAIPPSGSLWLGCRPRDRPPGTVLGEVELYLFRMWADLGDHGLCEDGTVIGWNSRYWGLTSPKARQTDPNLVCEHRWLRHGVRIQRGAPGTQARAERSVIRSSGSSVYCGISQLCPNKNVHFWMLISVKMIEEEITEEKEKHFQQWVSDALCSRLWPHGASWIQLFCHKQLKALQVNCKIVFKGEATCSVLVRLSHTCSAAQLKQAVGSALKHATAKTKTHGEIIGEGIRVGLCEDVKSPSGNFVRCQSTLSLDEICLANTQSKLTCSLIESNSNTDEWRTTESNSMTCGSSELPVHTLINLNWDTCDVKISNASDSDQDSHECGANKNLFVCLVENCPSTTAQSSTQSSDQSNSNESTADSSETNITEIPHMTTATTAAAQQPNAPKGSAQPTTTTPLTTDSRAQSSTAKPVLQTSSRNMPVTPSDSGTADSLNDLTTSTNNSMVDDVTSDLNVDGNDPPNTPSLEVTATAETTNSHEVQVEQAIGSLLNQTQNVLQLNSSQMVEMTGQLEKLLDGPTVSHALGQNAVNIISNLMGSNLQDLSICANRLVRLIDELSLKLVVSGDKEVISSKSLVLAVWKVDGTNFTTTFANIFNTEDVQIGGSQSGRSGSALGSVFLPRSLTTGLSPEQQQEASRVQFTYYTKPTLFQDCGLDHNTLVSPVLASSVANLSINNLSENIQFTIQYPINGNYSASCAFWDFSLNDGGGGWSTAGCFLVNTTADDTTCSCNHLTSFAILLDLSREGLTDPKQAQILSYITYIGCGISSIFLAVTLLTYLLFEKLLRDIPAKILVQFCMSLLLLNLVFMMDGWLALYTATGLCISTAFFLHYFLLTSFTWAGLEALHMYLSVIKVFTPYLSRYMLKFSLLGWGVPLVVVITVISVDKDNYGLVTYGKYANGSTDNFCWIRNDTAFYVGVTAYFSLIFALCLLVFIMVMVQLARIKKQNPHNQSPNRGLLTDMRSITGISILLGLTWGCALFAWGPVHLPFTYLFSIFNSLQGFFVFVFHCAAKENVRRQWKTYLCCGRLRLAENSEWSRMATQNNKTMSVTISTTPTPRFPSRSSSLVSDGTSSSGSVFADSGISDGFSCDVVLNEIHRQNMPVKTAPRVHW